MQTQDPRKKTFSASVFLGWLFLILITTAALIGNTVNYSIGRKFGALLLKDRPGRKPFIKPEHLEETHRFFEKWGGWAVTLGRFFPIIRTITPFVAGVGKMGFRAFTFYNVLGGLAWTGIFVMVGYFFGNLPWVKENFSLVVLALIVIPALPALAAFVRAAFVPKKKD